MPFNSSKLMRDALCLCSSLSCFLLFSALESSNQLHALSLELIREVNRQELENQHTVSTQMVNTRCVWQGCIHVTDGRDLHADGLKEVCAVAADAHACGWLVSVGGLLDPYKETKKLVHCDCLCVCFTITKSCRT